MTDQEHEAKIRTSLSGRTMYEGRPELRDEFLVRKLDEERLRVQALEDALRTLLPSCMTGQALPRRYALVFIVEFVCGMIAGYNLKRLFDALSKKGNR